NMRRDPNLSAFDRRFCTKRGGRGYMTFGGIGVTRRCGSTHTAQRRTSLPFRILAAAIFLAFVAPIVSAQQPDSLSFQRAGHLRPGINTSNGSAQAGDSSVQRLRPFTTADDIRLIRRLGFDHIRLSIDAEPLLAWQRKQSNGIAFMGELDAIVKAAN